MCALAAYKRFEDLVQDVCLEVSEIRADRNISQSGFAAIADLHPNTVGRLQKVRIEHLPGNMHLRTTWKIARAHNRRERAATKKVAVQSETTQSITVAAKPRRKAFSLKAHLERQSARQRRTGGSRYMRRRNRA